MRYPTRKPELVPDILWAIAVEKFINKHKFHSDILLIKNRIKIQNLFSLHAIDRNDMMRELLKNDP